MLHLSNMKQSMKTRTLCFFIIIIIFRHYTVYTFYSLTHSIRRGNKQKQTEH